MSNHKRSRGNKIRYDTIEVSVGPKTAAVRKEDRGLIIHRAEVFYGPRCPKTGQRTKTKCGKFHFVSYHSRQGFKSQPKLSSVKHTIL